MTTFMNYTKYKKTFTCMSACVALQIKGIVESLATKCAQVSLNIAVALHMSV